MENEVLIQNAELGVELEMEKSVIPHGKNSHLELEHSRCRARFVSGS